MPDKPPHEPTDPLAEYEAYAMPDWDGEGADPISPETLAAARQIVGALAEPAAIAPGADGSIGFQFTLPAGPLRHLWIDVQPAGVVKFYAPLKEASRAR